MISAPKILVSFLFSALTGLLIAGETDTIPLPDTIPTKTLGEVVITANRYGSLQMKTPEPIRVIDNKSFGESQLRTTPEALELTPGVFLQKTNHGGGSPFLRGLTGNQTLLLVDGIRLSNATARYGPNQYFNTIDVFSLEKIEVLRGSGSVQYGSDAMGGTIQTFSHELVNTEKSSWTGSLLTRAATQGMEKSAHGSVNYSSKKVAFRAGLTLRDFGDLIGGDTTGRQTPTGYGEVDFDLKGKILLSTSADLTMAYQNVHQSNVPVYHKVVLENYAINKMDPQDRDLAYMKFNKKYDKGLLRSVNVTAAYQTSEEGRELLKNNSSSLRVENDKVRSLTFSAEAYTSSENGWSANSGLEIYNDLVNSKRSDRDLTTDITISKRGLYPDGASMTSIAAFTIHTLDLNKWNFTAGARFNTFINKVRDEVIGLTTLTPSALVGNLGILRKLNSTSNLFVSLNSGFRAPNIDDLGTLGIVDFRYETPNFDLKHEHSFQYQTGYKFRNNNLSGEVYIYHNVLNNLIVRNKVPGDTIDGYPVYKKENIEHAYIRGAETAWDLSLNKSWMVSGALTYTYGQNITKKEPARRIPPLFGRLAMEYRQKDFHISLEWQSAAKQARLAAGDRDDNRIPSGGTPGWNVFNIYTSYTIRFVRVDLSLLNLLNEDYRYHGSGINGYGRSAFLSLTVNL